jgi:hypothetical protein
MVARGIDPAPAGNGIPATLADVVAAVAGLWHTTRVDVT